MAFIFMVEQEEGGVDVGGWGVSWGGEGDGGHMWRPPAAAKLLHCDPILILILILIFIRILVFLPSHRFV